MKLFRIFHIFLLPILCSYAHAMVFPDGDMKVFNNAFSSIACAECMVPTFHQNNIDEEMLVNDDLLVASGGRRRAGLRTAHLSDFSLLGIVQPDEVEEDTPLNNTPNSQIASPKTVIRKPSLDVFFTSITKLKNKIAKGRAFLTVNPSYFLSKHDDCVKIIETMTQQIQDIPQAHLVFVLQPSAIRVDDRYTVHPGTHFRVLPEHVQRVASMFLIAEQNCFRETDFYKTHIVQPDEQYFFRGPSVEITATAKFFHLATFCPEFARAKVIRHQLNHLKKSIRKNEEEKTIYQSLHCNHQRICFDIDCLLMYLDAPFLLKANYSQTMRGLLPEIHYWWGDDLNKVLKNL